MRLVPDQDAGRHPQAYTAYVKKHTPKGIETKIKVYSKGPACVVGTDNPFIKAATEALHDVVQEGHGLHSLWRVDSDRHRF